MTLKLAITQRVTENSTYYEKRDALSQEWVEYFSITLPEAIVIPVPNRLKDVSAWMTAIGIDGLVLSNGNDLGEAPDRDTTEKRLFEYCQSHSLPVLGVCRGLHVINNLLGGGVSKDISNQCGSEHVAVNHYIKLEVPHFIKLAGKEVIEVNSYHNHGILLSDLSSQCTAFALADNDVVEGIYHQSKPVLAIQWHPERKNKSSEFDSKLIKLLFNNDNFWNNQ